MRLSVDEQIRASQAIRDTMQIAAFHLERYALDEECNYSYDCPVSTRERRFLFEDSGNPVVVETETVTRVRELTQEESKTWGKTMPKKKTKKRPRKPYKPKRPGY